MAEGDIYGHEKDVFNRESMTVIIASPRIHRDISTLQNWWRLKPEIRRDAVPVDELGKPYKFCSGGHYSPRRAFDTDVSRRDGLHLYCKQCREEQRIRHRRTQVLRQP